MPFDCEPGDPPFDDPAGLKTYLDHETHLKFVKMYEPYFDMDKLQVFDFSDQKK